MFLEFCTNIFEECNVWKCRDQPGTVLPIPHWEIKYDFFLLNFKGNLTSQRFVVMNFTSKYSKDNDYLWYFLCWVAKKCCFLQFSVFSILYLISVIFFLCFPYGRKLTTLISPEHHVFWFYLSKLNPNFRIDVTLLPIFHDVILIFKVGWSLDVGR